MAFLVTFVAAMAAIWVVVKLFETIGGSVIELLRKPEEETERREAEAEFARINLLSFEIAKYRAVMVISNRRRFRCEPARNIASPLIESLAPLARELFLRFDAVSTVDGSVQIGPAYFRKAISSDFLEIGGSEDGTVYLKAHEESVYEHESLESATEMSVVAPSVYHWLLIVDKSFNGP